MLELLSWIVGQLPGLGLGAVGGGIGAFFTIRQKLKKDPKWVETLYQKQRAVGMQATEEMEKANAEMRKELADFKAKEAYDKLKAEIIKEIKGQ